MANLLTEKQKKIVIQEYYTRVAAFSFFIFSLLGIFVLIYVTLYFFSISKGDLIVADQIKTIIEIENKENVGESTARIVNKTEAQVNAVDFYTKRAVSPSNIFTKVIDQKNDSVRLNSLVYISVEGGIGNFSINGVAESRADLVSFVEKLKSGEGFVSVELPVSDFAKNSNVVFTISIKAKI